MERARRTTKRAGRRATCSGASRTRWLKLLSIVGVSLAVRGGVSHAQPEPPARIDLETERARPSVRPPERSVSEPTATNKARLADPPGPAVEQPIVANGPVTVAMRLG